MTEAEKPPEDSVRSKAEAKALLEEAEAEAAEAEALAAAARARARAARLRREALAEAKAEAAETAEVAEVEATAAETVEAEATPADDSDDEQATKAIAWSRGAPENTSEDADEEPAEETAEAVEPESGPTRRRRRLPWLSVILKVAAIVLICAFSGISGYLAWQDHKVATREQRAANFVAGARQGIINMTTLDFKRAKEDVQRLLDSSTGQFRDDFQQRAKDFTSVVEQSKVVAQGTVTAAALESMGENSASVLVLTTSRISNAAGAQDEPRVWRFRVTVTEEGGQYKMSKVDFVP
jgi:Mce-associated membrane protein